MYRFLAAFTVSSLLALAGSAAAQTAEFEIPAARTARGQGGALTPPSTASPQAALAQFLRNAGRDEATAGSVVETSRVAGRNGVTHVRFEQRAGGLPVYATFARAAFSGRGEILSVAENVVDVPPAVTRAQVGEAQAISAAVANLYPALQAIPPGFFRSAPSATRVAVPHAQGAMSEGFLVETWTEQSNELHYTLVSGAGVVLHVESRTQNTTDRYNVFQVNPNLDAQEQVDGPGAGNAESPSGWLFATPQNATDIAGNNVRAYLDVQSDNAADNPGASVTDGHFLAVADLAQEPSTATNRAVAVQNLFYLNNVIHDALYRAGFTESAGNFQENNFDNGGFDGDSVNAEAQDGGGTDNANFSTPTDGSNPRMQMYLWTGDGPTHTVVAGGLQFGARAAAFGPALDTAGVTGGLRLVNDGVGTTSDACESLARGSLTGRVALLDRGTCDFTVKVKNAQSAGAIAVVVANNNTNAPDDTIVMGGSGGGFRIPAVMVSYNSGQALRSMADGTATTVKLADVQPLKRDGDLDADIVFHEYCHGLTWRMIGGMSGPLAGAIGEGMSDVCAMLFTAFDNVGSLRPGADVIGEYSASSSNGIRREPYDGYDLISYGDIVGTQVHADGEVYAAIGWRLIELFGSSRVEDLTAYLVDGMNYTPQTPTFEQMRDGILESVANTPGRDALDECRVWNAFADFGVGVGARATVRGKRVTVTESNVLPPGCSPMP